MIKISTDPHSLSNITQFEYTLNDAAVWYDISHINGHAFPVAGVEIKPSVKAQDSCIPLVCKPGEVPCAAAYNNPDDVATHACSVGSDLIMTLCSGETLNERDANAAPEAAPETAPEAAPEAAAEPEPRSPAKRHLHGHQRRARRGTLGSHV